MTQIPNYKQTANTKLQETVKLFGILILMFGICFGFGVWNLVFPAKAKAQELSLSITPPLVELMIQPGKEYVQRYQLTNNGADTLVSVDIVPFIPSDELGNVDLMESLDPETASWFTLLSPQVALGEKFSLKSGASQEFALRINPSESAREDDYYLTVIFEADPGPALGNTLTSAKAKIGSNLLLTVSIDGRPIKRAKIVEFDSPTLVDSLGKITYKIRVQNTSKTFFKPEGAIKINSLFRKSYLLELAPVNILAGKTRSVPCVQDEALIECTLDAPVLLGPYWATLEFQTDGEGETYLAEAYTFAFPLSIILGLILIFFVIKIIRRLVKRRV